MNYVLVNHIPLRPGKAPGSYLISDLWLEDLRAQSRALASAGLKLVLAAPVPEMAGAPAGVNDVEISLRTQSFDIFPLPFLPSWKSLPRLRQRLVGRLKEAIETAEIVQISADMYGRHAWPLAGAAGVRRICVFDGGDLIGQTRLRASQEKNWAKRMVEKLSAQRLEKFCHSAVGAADLVYAHNPCVAEHLSDVWGSHCHLFERSFVSNEMILSASELAHRRNVLRDGASPL